MANASSSLDICSAPLSEAHLAVAYYDYDEASFEGSPGATDRTRYDTDLLLKPGKRWAFGFGHRSTILDTDDLEPQTNGYLHSFYFPLHLSGGTDRNSVRFSVAPALSGSSNVTKDPDQYSADAFQLLGALVWSRQLSERVSISYGICSDHRLDGHQVYPVLGYAWQPDPDLRVELGFPTSRLSYQVSANLSLWLRAEPDGNEWYVKSRDLQESSSLVYEAIVIESALRWRMHRQVELTASLGREFDGRFRLTLSDGTALRLASESATRIGFVFRWYF